MRVGGAPTGQRYRRSVDAQTILRRAIRADGPVLADLARAAYSPYLDRLPPGVRPAPLDASYADAIDRDEVWVAEIDGSVVGLLVLVQQPDHLLLENVAVRPDHHGHGVGGRLLDLAEERASAHALTAVRLYTHALMTENQRIYERRGYVVTARRQDGFDRVFYEKRLTAGPRPPAAPPPAPR